MNEDPTKTLKEELIEARQQNLPPKPDESLDRNKTLIIVAAMITLTAALVSGRMSESVYSGLMGSFLALTFGRIFSEQILSSRRF
ncbi:MAG: hypothetical protein OIN86_13585 [Candidatus Methanoperedens sp.]|nr:hypothetical protein [Candidatus Methanoperedens sp.]CAG0950556.1 hypothetical protein METP1_00174 [Methanosarcinales archaeon]